MREVRLQGLGRELGAGWSNGEEQDGDSVQESGRRGSEFVAQTPTRRILEAAEIANTVAFLASVHGASITGESLAVDGGITRGIFL